MTRFVSSRLRRSGFTLVELLVVIAFAEPLLVQLELPAVVILQERR